MYNEIVERVLLSKEEIQAKVKELGEQITNDYKDEEILAISILKGSVVFFADIIRAIDKPIEIDFMSISSYGNSSSSSGIVQIRKDLDINIYGKNILIIEDIMDTGLTLEYLVNTLKSREPKSIKTCTLLDKPERRKADIQPDYWGFVIPDEFVVGYGIDYAEKCRNLEYIGILKRSAYEK